MQLVEPTVVLRDSYRRPDNLGETHIVLAGLISEYPNIAPKLALSHLSVSSGAIQCRQTFIYDMEKTVDRRFRWKNVAPVVLKPSWNGCTMGAYPVSREKSPGFRFFTIDDEDLSKVNPDNLAHSSLSREARGIRDTDVSSG